jgi:hypothetical protein
VGGLTAKLEVAKQGNVKAVIDLSDLLFDDYSLKSDWQTQWAAVKEILNAPQGGYTDRVAAFYLADEPYINGKFRGIEPTTMKTWLIMVSDMIHSDFPSKPIAVILSGYELEPTWACTLVHCGLGLGSDYVSMFDWVGFDCYGPWDSCGGFHRETPYYIAILRSWLSGNQRLIAVPEGYVENQDPYYSVPLTTQAELIDRINHWHAQVLSDGKYVAVIPFLWQDIPAINLIGTRGMGWVKERFSQFATTLLGSGATSQIFPVSYSASNSWEWHVPFAATNRDDFDAWNAGAGPYQWIQFDLGGNTRVKRIDLLTEQVPAGGTTHHVYGRKEDDPSWSLLCTFQGYTENHQLLGWTGNVDLRYLLIITVTSPSWVAWREIRLFRTFPYITYLPVIHFTF